MTLAKSFDPRDVEERWNKGKFGKQWDECDDQQARDDWDLQLNLGRSKIFEVRRLYNGRVIAGFAGAAGWETCRARRCRA